MNLFHISIERYSNIRKHGWQLSAPAAIEGATYRDGNTTFHLLSDDRGFCEECGGEFESLMADTPVELERIKCEAAA